MSVVKYGRLMIKSWIDQGLYRRVDRCPQCGMKIQPNWKLIALVLKDLVDSSMRLKRISFPHIIHCSGCGRLLHINSEIVITGMEGGMRP